MCRVTELPILPKICSLESLLLYFDLTAHVISPLGPAVCQTSLLVIGVAVSLIIYNFQCIGHIGAVISLNYLACFYSKVIL